MKLTSAFPMAALVIACSFPILTQAQTCDNSGVGTKIPASKLELRGCGTTSSTSVLNATNKDSVSIFFVRDDGKVGLGTKTPSYDISFNGNTTRRIGLERQTNTNSAGSDVYIQASGATSGGTNLNGGYVYLMSGTCTGSGYSGIRFLTAGGPISGTGTTDRTSVNTTLSLSSYNGVSSAGINVGNSAPNGAFEVRAQAAPNGYEPVLRLATTDVSSSNDFFSVSNGVQADNDFAPLIVGRHSASSGFPGLSFIAQAPMANDAGNAPVLKFDAWSLGASGSKFTTRPVVQFAHGGVTQMIILANGRIGVGTDTPDQTFSVNGDASKAGGGSWATFSDKTVKKDIVTFTDGLEVLKKIKPVKFKYNSIYADTTKEFVGILAQDMQEIAPYTVKSVKLEVNAKDARLFANKKFVRKEVIKFPDATANIPDKTEDKYEVETLSYDQSAVFYIMVNAIKELDKKNKELESALELIQKRLAALEAK
jgi:hypothetical protein